MNKLTCGLIFFVALGGSVASAPSQIPENLPDPVVLRLPDGVTATVTARRIVPLSDAETHDPIRQSWSPDLVSATITRSGDDLIILQNWEGNLRSAVVSSGGNVLYQPSLRYPDDVQVNGDGAPDFSGGDFPWLAWIARDLFLAVESVSGRTAYKFSRTGTLTEALRAERLAAAEAAADAMGALKPEHRQAFIDSLLANDRREELVWLDNRLFLPIRSTDGSMEYSYSYRPASPPDSKIPPEFLRVIDALRKGGS